MWLLKKWYVEVLNGGGEGKSVGQTMNSRIVNAESNSSEWSDELDRSGEGLEMPWLRYSMIWSSVRYEIANCLTYGGTAMKETWGWDTPYTTVVLLKEHRRKLNIFPIYRAR
jgi:hypothetical protein